MQYSQKKSRKAAAFMSISYLKKTQSRGRLSCQGDESFLLSVASAFLYDASTMLLKISSSGQIVAHRGLSASE